MSDRTAKRSSDDSVFADVKKKKKKVAKDKAREVDVLKEKPVTACNSGNTRQKKAFFAYFGKSFDENKHAGQPVANGDGENATKNTEAKNNSQTEKIFTKAVNDSIDCLRVSTKTNNIEQTALQKKSTSLSTDSSFLNRNSNQPFVSSFLEEIGCFPKITHTNHSLPISTSDYLLCLNEETSWDIDVKNSLLTFQTVISVPEKLVLEPYLMEINFPYMISSIKQSVQNFPVSSFHQYMKKKCLAAKKANTDIECLWIDKYKPKCKEEVLGNSDIVKNLKNWLKPYKKSTNNSKKNQRYYDDDDFIFENESDSSHKAQHNLAILLGPSGCGKTSAVYAVANEINANIIELNASCNRNGKRLITDLMEATQSHAVEKNTLFNMMKVKKKKTKNFKNKEEANEKMTIILIEDADILFENFDEGFLPAISTLASDSKRPLVLTANDPFSSHLLKFFLSNEMVFNFIHPPKEHLNCFLQLMALNEGAIMTEEEINAFVNPFKPDIRQSTLQLQYVISSGVIDHKTPKNTCNVNVNSIWWNWPYILGCGSVNIEKDNQSKCNVDLATISQNLDALSKFNLIYSKTQSYDFLDPQPFWHHLATRDSASLFENHCLSNNSVQLSTDITQWIHNHINTQDYLSQKLFPSSEELSCRQKTWNTSKNVLEQIGLDYCNRKNETCFDYLAAIRSFGRNQVNKQFGNLRSSKMFSYLERINIGIDTKDLQFLCNSFLSSSNCNQSVKISDEF